MIELEFLGRSGDSRSVVFTDTAGERYSVLVTDELRAAVRREHTRPETQPTEAVTSLRPAHIQTLLRQGSTADELAEKYGVPASSIRRYESPVLAEKAWVIRQAQQCVVGPDPGSPPLEELAVNRLAARGVEPSSMTWSAQRPAGREWEVTLTFVQSAVERAATWSLSADGTRIHALDQEAGWLTESAVPPSPIRAVLEFGEETSGDFRNEPRLAEAEALLDELNAKRGLRQPLLEEFTTSDTEETVEVSAESTRSVPFFSGRLRPAAAAKREPSPSTQAADVEPSSDPPADTDEPKAVRDPDVDLPEAESGEGDAPATTAGPPEEDSLFAVETVRSPTHPERKRRSKRKSVPSWDEIVFGSRPE